MTNKEYLCQAIRLNEKINSDLQELDDLRQLALSIGSPGMGERVSSSKSGDPPFVKAILKIDAMERKLDDEIDHLLDLKTEISQAIKSVASPEEQILLRYRYINGYGWEKIGILMSVSLRTIHRIHASALRNFEIPPTQIKVDKLSGCS